MFTNFIYLIPANVNNALQLSIMNLHSKIAITTLLTLLLCIPTQVLEAQSPITLATGDLKAVFIDNSAYGMHRKGYNGISELYHRGQDSTLFVPFFTGLNLEHIFAGDSLISLFEPRGEPMTLDKLSDTKVVLHQPATGI